MQKIFYNFVAIDAHLLFCPAKAREIFGASSRGTVELSKGEHMSIPLSVLIPDGEDGLALLVARCLARSQNVKVYLLSSKRWPLARFSRHHCYIEFNPALTNPEVRFHKATELITKFKIDVILPVSEEGVEFVTANYQAFSEIVAVAPVPTLQSFETARDKWLLAQFADKHHLPVPPSIPVTLDSVFYQRLLQLKYPVLLKPTLESGGGRGIRQFDDPVNLQKFLEDRDERQFKNKYIVQSRVSGSDMNLNVLCLHGEILAFAIQQTLIGATSRFGFARAVQYIIQEEVLDLGRKLLAALNWSGVANIDILYDFKSKQINLIELNPRFWASTVGPLAGIGINFPYLSCLTALNVPFATPQYQGGKYIHTRTAIKEMLLQLSKKNNVDGFSFKETGLGFLLTDPLPEIMDGLAKWRHHQGAQGFIASQVFRFLGN